METEKHCLRVVVKVGTSTLTHDTGRLNLHNMELLARTLSDLEGMGHEVILVSSGAIAVGTAKMGLKARPTELRMKQAAPGGGPDPAHRRGCGRPWPGRAPPQYL